MKTQQTPMMEIGDNLIIVKTHFGCYFMNKQGVQVEDPETHSIKPREEALWEKYVFLKKRKIHTPHLCSRVKEIVQRISGFYQV